MTSEFFDDKPPQPRLSGMTRARGKRGQSGLATLVGKPAEGEKKQPAPEATAAAATTAAPAAAPAPAGAGAAAGAAAAAPAATPVPAPTTPTTRTTPATAAASAPAPPAPAPAPQAEPAPEPVAAEPAAAAPVAAEPAKVEAPAAPVAPAPVAQEADGSSAGLAIETPTPRTPSKPVSVVVAPADAGGLPEPSGSPDSAAGSPPRAPEEAVRARTAEDATSPSPSRPPTPHATKPRRQTARPAQAAARRAPAPVAEPSPTSAYQTPEQVSIYVTPKVKERAREMSRAEGIEYAQLAMDAIDHYLTEGVLGFLVQARLEVSRPNGSRFPPRRNLRSRSKAGVRRVLWPVQFRPAELDILTELVEETGAEHLSTLVSVAVEAYLLDDEEEGSLTGTSGVRALPAT